MTSHISDLPQDFEECVRFHGHSCPGLALGYLAAKAGLDEFKTGPAEDEELVCIVENDSCAVDAIQVMLGCTFGKGNLIFRDWGKQVYTFMDRRSGRSLRVALRGELPGRKERQALREKIEAGLATDEEKAQWEAHKERVIRELVTANPADFFSIQRGADALPPMAQIVETRTCPVCGEEVMESRMVEQDGVMVCQGCVKR